MAELSVVGGFYDKKICVVCGKEFYCKNGKKKPKHSYGIILRNRNCVTCSNRCVKSRLNNKITAKIEVTKKVIDFIIN